MKDSTRAILELMRQEMRRQADRLGVLLQDDEADQWGTMPAAGVAPGEMPDERGQLLAEHAVRMPLEVHVPGCDDPACTGRRAALVAVIRLRQASGQ